MKKVTKTIQKNIEVKVCDICSSEDIVIEWNFYSTDGGSGGSWDDWGEYHFCSFKHFLTYVKEEEQLWKRTDIENPEYLGLETTTTKHQYLTLSATGTGISEVTEFLRALRSVSE